MSSSFFADYTGGWSRTGAGQDKSEVGVAFTVTEDCALDAIRWFRSETVTAMAPEILRVWDVAAGTEVARATAIIDDGTVGWQTCAVAGAPVLTAARLYCCTGAWQAFIGWPQLASGFGVAPAPFVQADPARRYHISFGTWGFPESGDNNNNAGADPVVTPTAGGGGGSGGGGLTPGDLAAWLSATAGVNTHQADLPWLTKAGVDALAASIGNAAVLPGGTLSGGVAGLATQLTAGILSIKGVSGGTIAEVLTALSSLLQGLAALKSVLDGSGGGGRLGGAAGDGVTLIGQHQEIEDLINATSVLIADQSRRPPVGGDGWEFLANTEVTPNLAWDQMADAYLLNLSAYPSRYFGGDKSAGTYLPQIGWWCPLNGDFAGRQEPIRFAKSMLTVPGFRCAGVAVELKTGSVGVIEAWRYAG